MQEGAYKTLEALEGSWWHAGRVFALRAALRRLRRTVPVPQRGRVLDMGAGYGGMFSFLSTFGTVDALEPYPDARRACDARGYEAVYATADAIPVGSAYDVVGAFDVVEHTEDDAAFVRTMHEHLTPGGVLLITVPAFPFLWSKHDEAHMHYRRYTVRTLRQLVTNAGFSVHYTKYWNVTLFAPAAVLRVFNVSGEGTLHRPGGALDRTLRAVQYYDAYIFAHLPPLAGTGIVLVATRDK